MRFPRHAVALAAAALLLPACASVRDQFPAGSGSNVEMPGTEERAEIDAEMASTRERAEAMAAAGRYNAAARRLFRAARRNPVATGTADAAFRAGELYQLGGRPKRAAEAYQLFAERHKADPRFSAAVNAQFEIAEQSRAGKHSRRFLGLSTGISAGENIAIYENVIANKPRSPLAARSRLAIAEIHLENNRHRQAVTVLQSIVDANPDTPEAAEAQFRIARVFFEQAEGRNRDRSTAAAAREAFEDYLLDNPTSRREQKVLASINRIGEQQLRETFEIAKFYERTNRPRAAALYYREVARGATGELQDKANARLAALGAQADAGPRPERDAFSQQNDTPIAERDDFVGPRPSATPRRQAPEMRLDDNPS